LLWKKDGLRRSFTSVPSAHASFAANLDLERHISAFGNSKEQHSEEYNDAIAE